MADEKSVGKSGLAYFWGQLKLKLANFYTKTEVNNIAAKYLPLTGGTLSGNLTGKYLTGTWLQTTATTNLNKAPGRIAVLDDSGWVYFRTLSQLANDLNQDIDCGAFTDTSTTETIDCGTF